jgi:class 3 adenylate cyclase/tetratricopeptide (TPR) repeat protein
VQACPRCGAENPERAKFCLECGAALARAADGVREERKVVSILFCDLVGFTSASEHADPEDVRARVAPYYRRLRQEIERYGGTVEKFIGDAVMAVFGAPVSHEDDAERAVRAGLRILEAIDELNEDDPVLGLSVRIGITTGEVVVSLGARADEGEASVVGDVVNTAARLQAVAPAGGIVVGAGTFAATRDIFEYLQLEPVRVKGKDEPVPIWQAAAARARFGTDMRSHDTPLVGRDVEVNLVQQLFERALREKSPQLISIVGEPGVGKSRMVFELERYIDDHRELVVWRQGRCLPYGDGIAFWALGEIVKAEAGVLESDAPDVTVRKLDRAIPAEERDREWMRGRLGALVGLDTAGPVEQEESFTAWRRFLESIATTRPAVFVFEDVHWADRALLSFVEHVADWAEGVSIVLVCTARPELFERHPAWSGGTRNATTINLTPLGDRDTAQLVATLLDRTLLPAEVQAPIVEHSGGNPLYAEEFVRMLKDRGLLLRHGESWTLTPVEELPYPESVQALIAARLDTLAPDAKALVQDAAVIGKVFWAGALASMGGRGDRDVTNVLHELSRREIVRAVRASSMEGESEYAFLHALSRDVAYAQIPRPQRVVKHEAALRWIQQRAGEREEDLADVLAYHALEGLELAVAAGLDQNAESLRPIARAYLALAGERAARLDIGRALKLYAQALELTREEDAERPVLLERLGKAAFDAGRFGEAEECFADAAKLFRAAGNRADAGRALLARADALHLASGSVDAYAELERAYAMIEESGDEAILAEAHEVRANFEFVRGRDPEALLWADRALDLQRPLGLEGPTALGIRGGVRAAAGDVGGIDDLKRAVARAQEAGGTLIMLKQLNNLALASWPYEGPIRAYELTREAVAVTRSRGATHEISLAIATSLECLFDMGEWSQLIADGESHLAEVPADSSWVASARTTVELARASRGEHRPRQLAALVEDTVNYGDPQTMLAALLAAAVASVHVRDESGGRASLTEIEGLPDLRGQWSYPRYLAMCVRLAIAFRDVDLAERLLEGVDELTPLHRYATVAARAALAEAHGDLVGAIDLYGQAADAWQGFGHVPEHAFAELGRGRCLAALGRSADAGVALGTARELFVSLAAAPVLMQIDELLGEATALTS